MRRSNDISLELRQQPLQALVTGEHKEKIRKAVDPPPIVQLRVNKKEPGDQGNWLVNPFLFMIVHLVEPEPVNGVFKAVSGSNLLGTTVSSLHKLKDVDNKDGGFFVFGDISCRRLGMFRLQFHLFDLEKGRNQAAWIAHEVSNPFPVVTSKDFRGQMESTSLSRTFSDQGVRLRLRKEQRTITGSKRGYAGSPNSSSTPLVPYRSQGDPHSDELYGHNPPKRQRSDNDYNPHVYHTPHISSNAMFQYSSHALQGHPQQAIPTSHGDFFGGMMNQSHAQTPAIPQWHRPMQQHPLSAPVGASGNYQYFNPLNPSPIPRQPAIASHAHHQHPQYSLRAADPSSDLGVYQVPSSVPETVPPSHHDQVYSHPSLDRQSHDGDVVNLGPTAYSLQTQQSPASGQSHFSYRAPLSHASEVGYDPGIQPPTSSAAHDQLQPRSAGPYEQGHFPSGQAIYPGSARDTYPPNTETPSDAALSLNSGVLNRAFIPPYLGQNPGPAEQDSPEFKEHPYPTPH